jgi:hypothetical protein
MASLIEVTEQVTEMNLKNELRVSKQRADLIITENKFFGAAVSMMSKELVGKSYIDILESYPDVTSIDWNPLDWTIALISFCCSTPVSRTYELSSNSLSSNSIYGNYKWFEYPSLCYVP